VLDGGLSHLPSLKAAAATNPRAEQWRYALDARRLNFSVILSSELMWSLDQMSFSLKAATRTLLVCVCN
jgi:hypothetical protein